MRCAAMRRGASAISYMNTLVISIALADESTKT
jgi:hypothetical protein